MAEHEEQPAVDATPQKPGDTPAEAPPAAGQPAAQPRRAHRHHRPHRPEARPRTRPRPRQGRAGSAAGPRTRACGWGPSPSWRAWLAVWSAAGSWPRSATTGTTVGARCSSSVTCAAHPDSAHRGSVDSSRTAYRSSGAGYPSRTSRSSPSEHPCRRPRHPRRAAEPPGQDGVSRKTRSSRPARST